MNLLSCQNRQNSFESSNTLCLIQNNVEATAFGAKMHRFNYLTRACEFQSQGQDMPGFGIFFIVFFDDTVSEHCLGGLADLFDDFRNFCFSKVGIRRNAYRPVQNVK